MAAVALAVVAFAGFVDSLLVTDRDLAALGSGNEDLVVWAVAHIFEGAGPGLRRALAALIPAVVLLWIVAASLGRAATLSAVVNGDGRLYWRSILALHVLRAALAAAAIMAILGAMIFAARISAAPDGNGFGRDAGVYILTLLFAIPPIVLVWRFLNWLLTLAAVFAVQSGASVGEGIARAGRALQEQKGRFLGAAALFGVMRLVALVGLWMASVLALAAFSGAGVEATLAALLVLALAYFVVADFLYIARLAAYVEICRPEPPPRALVATGQP